MSHLHLHPVDWFNTFGSFKDIFKYEKEDRCNVKSLTEVCFYDPKDSDSNLNQTTYKLTDSCNVKVERDNPHDLASGSIISKFTLLTALRFKGDFKAAESYVMYKLMEMEVPYVRIGTDYYSIESKKDRYGGINKHLSVWKKDTIVEDHTKNILKAIPKYHGFTIEPDNICYSAVHGKYYNIYNEFIHKPHNQIVKESEITTTINLLKHIFGDKFNIGIKYMKILYEHPKQILPILVLVSEERETGKTTFLNWIQMVFGQNSILINPSDLLSNFNSSYSTKNIILIDEAFVEKGIGVEKLKSIATAKQLSVNAKHIQPYSVDFYGKVIMCSNKELDFMRIDNAEIRFFIRKIKSINGTRNTNIEADLFNEIPRFLKYLTQLPQIDFTKSRMVFTKEDIGTPELENVKKNSRVALVKDIEIRIRDLFLEKTNTDAIYATAGNIHDKWFKSNSHYGVAYIRKILNEEFKLPEPVQKWYFPLGEGTKIKNRPYKFDRINFLTSQEIEDLGKEEDLFEEV